MRSYKIKLIPERLQVSVGGHFGTSFSVCLEGGLLTYKSSKSVQNFPPKWDSRSEEIQPSDERWQAFRAALDRIDLWRWQADYPNSAMVCDGTSWSVEIMYPDHQLLSCGCNCFPGENADSVPIHARRGNDAFDRFCKAISLLVGRPFR